MMLSFMFKPPSILQSDIIMEFSITTSDDIIVSSPMLTLGPMFRDLVAGPSILQFLPIIHRPLKCKLYFELDL